MSKYTTEVRFICESLVGYDESKGYDSVDNIVTKAAPIIFDFNFPIFDENYRLLLEKRILKHFYTREICEETVGLWKLRLEDRLNLIMPYYNKLYESALIEFNPLEDVDVDRIHDGTDSRNNTANGLQWRLFSDTPQGGINGITADEDSVANNTYLTDATKVTNNDTSNSNGTLNYKEKVKGKQGPSTYSKMLEEFRKTFRKIDEEIMNELNPLFFGLWN